MNPNRLRQRAALTLLVSIWCVVADGAGAAPDPPPDAVLATLPFLGDEPNRVYIDLAPEGSVRPFRLMLDTGASDSVLTPLAARALGVRVRRTKSSAYRRKTLLGRDLQFYVDTRRSDTGSQTGWEYGVLGGRFLADYVLELDFPARRVRFLDRKRYEVPESVDRPDEAVLPLTVVGNRPGIEIGINGVHHTVLLDSGAPTPLIVSGPNAARSSLASEPIPGFGFAGVKGDVATELGLVERVTIGPFAFDAVPTIVAPRGFFNQGFPGDTLIGYDLLAQFVMRIDYSRARIWLKRVPEPRITWLGQPWSEVEQSGAHLAGIAGQDGYQVRLLLPGGIADRRGLRTGDLLPSPDTASEVAARIAAGEPLRVIRPGRRVDDEFDLPRWSSASEPAAGTPAGVQP